MRRRLLFLLALAGVLWLYLRRSGRRPQPFDSGPADELRRKLDETGDRLRDTAGDASEALRDAADEAGKKLDETKERVGDEASELAETSVTEDLDAKRREVHERARETVDEMRDSSSD
jgi:hypothetical protein